jgi:hypothetical protein
MIASREKVLEEMVAAIVQKIDPEPIYLFGSHVQRDNTPIGVLGRAWRPWHARAMRYSILVQGYEQRGRRNESVGGTLVVPPSPHEVGL